MRAFGGIFGLQRQPPLTALLEDFEAEMLLTAGRTHARRTVRAVRRFLWTAAIRCPDDITAAVVRAFLTGLSGRSAKTLLNYRSAISRFCEFLRERSLLAGNPCRQVRLAPIERRPPRFLEDHEIQEVLKLAADAGIWAEVALALATGLRLSEMVRLRWEDVDFHRRCLLVRRSKSRRPRVVPLSSLALRALEAQYRLSGRFDYVFPARQAWRGGCRYLNRPRPANRWLEALKPIQEAIPKFRTLPGRCIGRGWHLFRHTFASKLAQAGVSLYKIAAWLGHSDIRTTQIYAHLQVGYDSEIEAAALVQATPAVAEGDASCPIHN